MPAMFDPSQLRRVLVTKLRHHGDVLLATPVLSTLKRIAPQCEIDALVYADTAPMMEGHPALSQLHCIDRAWKTQGLVAQAKAEGKLLSTLRGRKYDLVVHLSVHTRGAWIVRMLRPRWSVGPCRRDAGGFWHRSFSYLYASQSHADRHTVETNLDSLRTLGIAPVQSDKRVVLVPGPAAEQHVEQWLHDVQLGTGKFIHVHPASRWLFKCWPAERVAALCDALSAKGWPVVLTSAPDAREMALIASVRAAAAEPVIDFSGQLSLKQLAAMSARARLFVGVDSAPMHIAAAMDTPTVGIFGPSGDREWGPWDNSGGHRHRVVASLAHNCRPCGRAGCNDSKISECLTDLPVDQVLATCEEMLA
jgi:heptosyltransferase-3